MYCVGADFAFDSMGKTARFWKLMGSPTRQSCFEVVCTWRLADLRLAVRASTGVEAASMPSTSRAQPIRTVMAFMGTPWARSILAGWVFSVSSMNDQEAAPCRESERRGDAGRSRFRVSDSFDSESFVEQCSPSESLSDEPETLNPKPETDSSRVSASPRLSSSPLPSAIAPNQLRLFRHKARVAFVPL